VGWGETTNNGLTRSAAARPRPAAADSLADFLDLQDHSAIMSRRV